MKTLAISSVALGLIVSSAITAQPRPLHLPPVPHYELPVLPPIAPIKPPFYTEKHRSEDTSADYRSGDEYWYEALWRWLIATYSHTVADPVALFTFVLATSTIGLWISTWVSGIRQSRETRRTIKTMERTERRQLRAYVFVDGGSMSLVDGKGLTFSLGPGFQGFPQGQVFVQVHTVFRNFGRTPAYDFKLWRKVDVWDTNAPQFEEIGDRNDAEIIGPGADFEITAMQPISKDEFDAVVNRSKSIFSWGRIDYIDVFDEKQFFEFYHTNGIMRSSGWPQEPASKHYRASR